MASEPNAAERQALARLERAVTDALARLERLRDRTEAAETRARELEELLRSFASGNDSPGQVLDRLREREAENHRLRDRIRSGREVVERLLARVRFLEEHR